MKRHSASECNLAMKNATDYHSWFAAAVEYDMVTGMEAWKNEESSTDFHYEIIQKRLKQLRQADREKNVKELVYTLREGLVHNFGNISNPALYHKARTGTKHLITDYVNEAVILLKHLCENPFPGFPRQDKLKFFKQVGQSFGRSALLLSGGGPFGIFHIGVIKTLVEHRLLPHVISGSSIGSLIAAILGSHTDEELQEVFQNPLSLFERNMFAPAKGNDFIRKQHLMDIDSVITYLSDHVSSMTFEEAYEKTHRIINISVSPAYQNQHPYLANYLTTPHVTIRSAVQASCAIPGVYKPSELSAKNSKGELTTYMESLKWVDGGMTNDLPMQQLREMFNVNHHIVSLVNPLAFPFAERRNHGMPGMVRKMLRTEVRLRLQQALELAMLYQNRKKPQAGTKIQGDVDVSVLAIFNGLLEQQYRGDITIFPPRNLKKYLEIIRSPIPENYKKGILEGERATWKELEMIRNQTLISKTLDSCIQTLES